jgi:MGT family glycosyltransferase
MARAFFLNIPAHGHVNPTLPLVRELVDRGERIIYYSGEEFRGKVAATGAEFRTYESLGDAVRFRFGDTSPPSPNLAHLARLMLQFTEDVLPPLLDLLKREQPQYILHDFACIWGLLAAGNLAIPAVATIPQFPVSYRRRPDPYPGMWRSLFRQMVSGIPHLRPFNQVAGRLSATYGTRRISLTNFMSNHEDLNIVFTSRYFQPNAEDFDDSFVFVGPSIAPRDESIDFSLDFPAHCTGPLVYISLGSTILATNVAFYRACFQAFGETDKRVILSAGRWTDPEALAAAPPNFIIQPYVPQLEVLKMADVFITHGGMGSVSEGLLHGVPLIVVPQTSDQPFVAQRVRRLGAGYALFRQPVRPAELDRLVDAILTDQGVRAECDRIAESFREAGGFVRAADVILEYLASHAPSPKAG